MFVNLFDQEEKEKFLELIYKMATCDGVYAEEEKELLNNYKIEFGIDQIPDTLSVHDLVQYFAEKTDDKKKITRITAISAAAGLGFNVIFEPVIGYLYRRYLLGTSAEAASILSAWLGGVTAFNAVVCLFVSVLLYRALYKQYRSLI